jgi:hypothetical protein
MTTVLDEPVKLVASARTPTAHDDFNVKNFIDS